MADIPKYMQAVFLEKPAGSPAVSRTPIAPPGPGSVLVRMSFAPINPSDPGFIKGA